MTISVVTGLGFGDEGKGATVDYLARQGSTVVCRHSGGSQSGHNVIDEGRHHCFAQFGAGTFAGASTFLSRHMLVNPLNQIREANHLIELGELDVWDRMHIDGDAKIVTPWHASLNRLQRAARGGSCGQGIGVTMRQEIDHPELTVRVNDLLSPDLSRKLDNLRRYLGALGLAEDPFDWAGREAAGVLADEGYVEDVARRYREWVMLPNVVQSVDLSTLMGKFEQTVFEGAQGVLLDEWYGFHPYTTWSTTTPANALALLAEAGWTGPVNRIGVTRAYMTRHGAGPFPTEDSAVRFAEPHNLTGQYQGAFRQGHLDVSLLRYAIEVCGGIDELAVTHTDRSSTWRFSDSYEINGWKGAPNLQYQQTLTDHLRGMRISGYEQVNTAGLLSKLGELAPVGLVSYGPTADDKTVIARKVPV